MSQGSLNVPTVGPDAPTNFATQINTALDALISKNSGSSSPTNFPTTSGAPTQAQDWWDTSPGGGIITDRIYDGSQFLEKGAVDTTNHIWMPKVGGGNGTIAAAATTDLGSVPQTFITLTGAVPGTPITSFGNNALLQTGESRFLRVTAGTAGIITFNATSMILPMGVDLSFNGGDTFHAIFLGGGNWLVRDFHHSPWAIGQQVIMYSSGAQPAQNGLVRANGNSIGNASSNATERANADTVNLFIFMYLANNALTLQNSAGTTISRTAPGNTRAAAITDYNGNNRLVLPTISGFWLAL